METTITKEEQLQFNVIARRFRLTSNESLFLDSLVKRLCRNDDNHYTYELDKAICSLRSNFMIAISEQLHVVKSERIEQNTIKARLIAFLHGASVIEHLPFML